MLLIVYLIPSCNCWKLSQKKFFWHFFVSFQYQFPPQILPKYSWNVLFLPILYRICGNSCPVNFFAFCLKENAEIFQKKLVLSFFSNLNPILGIFVPEKSTPISSFFYWNHHQRLLKLFLLHEKSGNKLTPDNQISKISASEVSC